MMISFICVQFFCVPYSLTILLADDVQRNYYAVSVALCKWSVGSSTPSVWQAVKLFLGLLHIIHSPQKSFLTWSPTFTLCITNVSNFVPNKFAWNPAWKTATFCSTVTAATVHVPRPSRICYCMVGSTRTSCLETSCNASETFFFGRPMRTQPHLK